MSRSDHPVKEHPAKREQRRHFSLSRVLGTENLKCKQFYEPSSNSLIQYRVEPDINYEGGIFEIIILTGIQIYNCNYGDLPNITHP